MPDNKEKYAQLQASIEKHKGERGAVMPVLQEAMSIFGYVPQDVQEMIADGLGVTLSEVYGTISEELKIQPGDTTDDGLFTLNATRCLGACGLAPVMMIGEEVYGRLTPDQVSGILDKYRAAK